MFNLKRNLFCSFCKTNPCFFRLWHCKTKWGIFVRSTQQSSSFSSLHSTSNFKHNNTLSTLNAEQIFKVIYDYILYYYTCIVNVMFEIIFFIHKLTLKTSFNVDEGSTCDNNVY